MRASGTEPMLRLYSETTARGTTRHLFEEVMALVKQL